MRAHVTMPTLLAAAALALALAAAAPAGANARPKCQNLAARRIPFGALEASYRALTGLPSSIPLSRTEPRHYGVCGATHYAFALLVVATGVKLTYRQQVAQQDHSPIWIEKPGRAWVDEGIDDVCNLAPAQLINLWKLGVTCRSRPAAASGRRRAGRLRLPPPPS